MAQRSAKRPPSTKRASPSAKKKKGPAIPVSRFDGEAFGLVLVALGVFLGVTVALPPTGEGFMASASNFLTLWAGPGAYLLPIPPLCYGALVFLGRDLANLTRRILGGVLVSLSALCLYDLFAPGEAGRLAALLTGPMFSAVGYVAGLVPLLALTLGVEVFFTLAPFTIVKAFVRALSLGTLGAVGFSRDLVEAQQGSRGRVKLRSALRGELMAHERELAALDALFPDSKELRAWRKDTRAALRDLHKIDEEALEARREDLQLWREVTRDFTSRSARDLAAAIEAEGSDLAVSIEEIAHDVRKGRHVLAGELAATHVCATLERVRKGLTVDLVRLATKAANLERDRARAKKALEAVDAAILAREVPKQVERAKEWAEFAKRAAAWTEQAAFYDGWPELASRFDTAPADLGNEMAAALASDPETTLREREAWRAKLDAAIATRAAFDSAAPVSVSALPEPTDLLINLDFGVTKAKTPDVVAAPPEPEETAELVEDEQGETVDEREEALEPVEVGQRVVLTPAPLKPSAKSDTPPWEDAPETESAKGAGVATVGAIDLSRPDVALLDPLPKAAANLAALDAMARGRAELINETLAHFGLSAKVVDFARGPTVTRYEIEPAPGEKISRIASLANDLARALAVGGVRVEAPVPGKSVIGLEVPNAEREPVTFHTVMATSTWKNTRAKLPIVLGKSIDGEMMIGDLAKMPHLLIAGSTGSGKSVCVNTLITSLLFRYLPTELRFLMVDPKMVELTPYDGIPHLVRGVVTNPADAAGVLLGAVAHMERRYKMMSVVGAKNLEQFNAKMRLVGEPELPHLVIIIDELADLMITSPKEVESAIMRLAQMARATGMHLVLATQRPSVDILTSLIKVNVPARIAFAVSSSHDSRTILDSVGAERLTGMGDMLFYQPGLVKPQRLQGPYISENETVRITEFLRRQVFEDAFGEAYGADFDGLVSSDVSPTSTKDMDFSDPFLRQAAEICIEEGQGSVSRLQRRLSVGHARAGKLMDMLEAMGIVSKHQGSKPRDVLISRDDLPEYFGR
ncbi:DNA translocase FtsK [Deinococcus yavapaiensis]|uniref:S-DNA-T family DNA segregation ATPase FtsK/SpoIIIE n=1 Tax=Deinococcus yavapaiensis KR-236 TaxID=694435 RepID=A0A318SCB1_9DEIO|nr:DNA translocase FtsK [Deinococcus yavapaiensis]PYE56233.1 S-DNA-T family DNA segregation ATPase FtsK/SpoIIIE [Deinococcus yavapaiensis KR-236]